MFSHSEVIMFGIMFALVIGLAALATIRQMGRYKFEPGVSVMLSPDIDLPISKITREPYERLLSEQSIGKIIYVNKSYTLWNVEFLVNGKPQEFLLRYDELRLVPIEKKSGKESAHV